MAATDAGLDHVVDQTHKVATNLAASEQSAEGLGNMFKQAALTFVGIDMVRKAVVDIVERTTTWQSLSQAVSKENLTRSGLLKREMDLLNEKHLLDISSVTAAGIDGEYQKARLLTVGQELEILQKQKVVAVEMQRVGHVSLGLLLIYKGLMVDLFLKSRQFNQNLIEANASATHRERLLRETLMTQTQLGIGFDSITKSAAALVHYGLDTEKSFNDNLRLVSQMEQGLGVSVSASAQLASIVERQIKGSFTDVAHVIAQIVDDTALAGDEAVRLATNIATAMGRLRPGISAQGLPEVVKLVGRYESALKEVGGAPGAFQQLVTSLTTPGGIVGAGALGATPEFLATSQGVQNVMDRFSKFGNMLVGQSQGWDRQFRLQMLADVFGTSADAANQMLIAIKRANAKQMESISLQDRWHEQLNATNSGISRLANSLLGLTQGGLHWIVIGVGWLTNRLADLVEMMLKSRTVVYAAGIALAAGFFVLVGRMWGLVRSLVAVAVTASAAATQLARMAAANAAAAIPSAAPAVAASLLSKLAAALSWSGMAAATKGSFTAFGAATGFLPKIGALLPTFSAGFVGILSTLGRIGMILRYGFAVLTGPVGIISAVVIGLGIYAVKQYSEIRRLREEAKEQEKILISKQDALAAHTRMKLYAAGRAGSSEEEILKIYASLARQSTMLFDNIKDPALRLKAQEDWRAKQLAEVPLDLLKGAVTAGQFTPLTERTPEQAKHEDAMLNISAKLLKVNEAQTAYADKAAKRDEENARDAEIDRAKNRSIFYRGKANPLRYLSDSLSDWISQ